MAETSLIFMVRVLSTVKMEAVRSSETSVNFYRSTECQIAEDCNMNSHYCENLISFIMVFASLKFFKFFTCVYKFDGFFYRSTAPVGLVLLIVEVSRSQSDTPHSVGFPCTSDRPDAETSTCLHTLKTHRRHTCSGGIRTRSPSTRYTADPCLRPLGHCDPQIQPLTHNKHTASQLQRPSG